MGSRRRSYRRRSLGSDCLFDADLGLANIDVMLGIPVEYTLHDVFTGKKSLPEIVVDGPEGISVIPAASGVGLILFATGPIVFMLELMGFTDLTTTF